MTDHPPMTEAPPAGDVAPRRPPEAVIADYLSQFVEPDQAMDSPGPEPQGLIRWLRDEGWEIRPASPA